MEISGGHNYGGYHYSLSILNQNTSGATAAGANVSPEVGIFSDSNFKDIYGRFQYRFNLEKDTTSRNDVQAAGANGPRIIPTCNSEPITSMGDPHNTCKAKNGVLTAQEPFYRTGGDFSFNYRTFNLFGLYMYGHDKDLIFNNGGTGFVNGAPSHFSGGFLEADYLALPWLMAIMRYDRVQSEADLVNASGGTALITTFPRPAPRETASVPAYSS